MAYSARIVKISAELERYHCMDVDPNSVEKIGTSLPPHCIRTKACLVDLNLMS